MCLLAIVLCMHIFTFIWSITWFPPRGAVLFPAAPPSSLTDHECPYSASAFPSNPLYLPLTSHKLLIIWGLLTSVYFPCYFFLKTPLHPH